MPRIKVRFGAVFLLALALTFVSGLACADGDSGTPIKQINGPNPSDASTESPVHVTANVFSWSAHEVAQSFGQFAEVQNVVEGMRAGAFSSISTTASNNPTDDKNGPCSGNSQGKPIEVNSGTKIETYPIFALPGEMGLKYVLYYNNSHNPAWTSNLQYWLDTDCSVNPSDTGRCHQTIAHRSDGSTITFSGGPSASVYQETFDNGQSVANPVAVLTRNPTTGNYTLQDEDALTEVYASTGQLLSITDPSGIGWTFSYPVGANGTAGVMPSKVTHTDGQSITINAGPVSQGMQNGQHILGQVVTVTDPGNNTYTFDYGNAYSANAGIEDLASIAFPGSPSTVIGFQYTYFSNTTPPAYGFTGFTEVDYNGTPYTYTSYNTTANSPYYRWGTGTWLADGTEKIAIAYAPDSAGNLSATITNPLGHVAVNTYDGTNGTGGAYNGLLSSVSNDAVAGCGATVASRAYDANGNLAKTVDNNGNVHTYTYAGNGQLQTETEAYGTPQARTTDYVWDPNLQLNRLSSVTVEGWSKTVYSYNAQNRLASVAVTNLSGNGIANQTLTTSYGYTLYANGMVQTMTVTHPSPNNSDTETSQYDTLGNLTSMSDGLGHTTTYGNYNGLGEAQTITGPNGDVTNYTYDARDRMATKTIHPNGGTATWTYGYDGFGLLASVNAPDGEVTTWQRDAEMRVHTVTHNDKDGTATETYGYDANSDVTSDTISRNGTTTYATSALYNALGRPYQINGNHGQQLTYSYDGNGNVLAVTNAAGHVTGYQYDPLGRVASRTDIGGATPVPPSAAPSLSAPSTSSGSYTVSWTGVSGATTYLLQEQTSGGNWGAIQNSSATTRALSGKPSTTFGYRVQACNATGCGPWSNTGSVIVTHVTGNIDDVSIDGSGNASVSGWACSTGLAESISVDLYLGGPYGGAGTFIGRYNANQASEPAVASACAVSSGSYRFSISLSTTTRSQYVGQPIYVYGISPVGADNLLLNNAGSFKVPINVPIGAPTLSLPASSSTGTYGMSWSPVANAANYVLQQQIDGGGWSTVQNAAATSWQASGIGDGTDSYRVQACNSSGCGPWSTTQTVRVAIIPSVPSGLHVVSSNPTSSALVLGWNASPDATSYNVQANGSSPASTTTTTYREYWYPSVSPSLYRVNACNANGCSGWSDPIAVPGDPFKGPPRHVPLLPPRLPVTSAGHKTPSPMDEQARERMA